MRPTASTKSPGCTTFVEAGARAVSSHGAPERLLDFTVRSRPLPWELPSPPGNFNLRFPAPDRVLHRILET